MILGNLLIWCINLWKPLQAQTYVNKQNCWAKDRHLWSVRPAIGFAIFENLMDQKSEAGPANLYSYQMNRKIVGLRRLGNSVLLRNGCSQWTEIIFWVSETYYLALKMSFRGSKAPKTCRGTLETSPHPKSGHQNGKLDLIYSQARQCMCIVCWRPLSGPSTGLQWFAVHNFVGVSSIWRSDKTQYDVSERAAPHLLFTKPQLVDCDTREKSRN